MSHKVTQLPRLKESEQARRPIMVRDLNGRIYYWNSDAESKYGWEHTSAIGNVSHDLLSTVFPQPLDLINNELMTRGYWKGELIHTRADGTRVKVQSSWQLYRDAKGQLCTVLEVNDNFFPLEPGDAHLTALSRAVRTLRWVRLQFTAYKWWFLGPMLLAIMAVAAVVAFTPLHHAALTP